MSGDACLHYSRSARAWLEEEEDARPSQRGGGAGGRGVCPAAAPPPPDLGASTSTERGGADGGGSASDGSVTSAGLGAGVPTPHRPRRRRKGEGLEAVPPPPPPPPPARPPHPPARLTPSDHASFLEAERLLASGQTLSADAAARHAALAQRVAAVRAAHWAGAWAAAAAARPPPSLASLDPATAAAVAAADRSRAERVSRSLPRAWAAVDVGLDVEVLRSAAAGAVASTVAAAGAAGPPVGAAAARPWECAGLVGPPPPLEALTLLKPGSAIDVSKERASPPAPPLHADGAARSAAATARAAAVVAAPALAALASAAVEAPPPPGWPADDWCLPVVVEAVDGGQARAFVGSPLPRRSETLREAVGRAAKAALLRTSSASASRPRSPTLALWTGPGGASVLVRCHDRGGLAGGAGVPPAPCATLDGGDPRPPPPSPAQPDPTAATTTTPVCVRVALQYGSPAEADREEEPPGATAAAECAAGLRAGWGGALLVAHVAPGAGGVSSPPRLLRWRRLDGREAAARGGAARGLAACSALLAGLRPLGAGRFLVCGGGGGGDTIRVYAALTPQPSTRSSLPPLPVGGGIPGASSGPFDLWAALTLAAGAARRPPARPAPPVWRSARPGVPQVPHTPAPVQGKQQQQQQQKAGGKERGKKKKKHPPAGPTSKEKPHPTARRRRRAVRRLPLAWTLDGVDDWDKPGGGGWEDGGGVDGDGRGRAAMPGSGGGGAAALLLGAAAAEL